ncbi:MAG: hypothetical protein K6G50_01505 [bacterium]|nr:hypothetical protein [bacterium]
METSGEFTELIIPFGLSEANDPLRKNLSVALTRLHDELMAPEEDINYVATAWDFRAALDIVTVFIASAAISPLSSGDAPLPGWRRSLWEADFSDAASGLLSWAMAYLPRRSRQNILAQSILEFLYADGSKHTTNEPRSYAGLLGIGSSISGAGAWQQWRNTFFALEDLNRIKEMAPSIKPMLVSFNEMLQPLDDFLARWTLTSVIRSDVERIVLRGEANHELPPFLVLSKCSQCGEKGLFALASPGKGERFLYREMETGHLEFIVADPTFRRRFFTAPPQERFREDYSSYQEPAALSEEETKEINEKLLKTFGQYAYEHMHMPVLAAVSRAGVPFPRRLLADPGFGCRNGDAVAAHMAEMLPGKVFAAPSGEAVANYVSTNYSDICQGADRMLAEWAEARILEKKGQDPLTELAVSSIGCWVKRGGNKESALRIANSEVFGIVRAWLDNRLNAGVPSDRELALKVANDWIEMLEELGEQVITPLTELHIFRASVFRESFEHQAARTELDKALGSIGGSEAHERLKAQLLGERARINAELDSPGFAAEDCAFASAIWEKLSSTDKDAMAALVEITGIRAKALLNLGHRAQAVAIMQKVAARSFVPRDNDEILNWINLNLELGEMLRSSRAPVKSVRAKFEEVMRWTDKAPVNSRIREAEARSARVLAENMDSETACNILKQSSETFRELISKEHRLDLRPVFAEVLGMLAHRCEDCGRVEEAENAASNAAEVFEELVKNQGVIAYKASLGEIWLLCARLAKKRKDSAEAENSLTKAIAIFTELTDDGQDDLAENLTQAYAMRGSLRAASSDYSGAEADLRRALARGDATDDLKYEIYRDLAGVSVSLGKLEESLEFFDEAVRFAEEKEDRIRRRQFVNERAWVLYKLGYAKRATEDFTSLLQRGVPEEEEPRIIKAKAASRLRMQEYEEASSDFASFLEENPDDLDCLIGAGLARLGLGENVMAAQTLKKVLEITQSQELSECRACVVLAHAGLAEVHRGLGAADEKTEYLKVCEIWNEGGDRTPEEDDEEAGLFGWEISRALLEGAAFALDEGRCDEALKCLDSALRLSKHPGIREEASARRFAIGGMKARALSELGRFEEAGEAAAEVLRDYSGADELRMAAWLNYCCGRSALLCGREGADYLAAATALYDSIDEEDDEFICEKALSHALQGRALVVADSSSSLEHLDNAVNLFTDLRERRRVGFEWECSLSRLFRALTYKQLNSVDSAAYDLEEIPAMLKFSGATETSGAWMRTIFVKIIADVIPEAVSSSANFCGKVAAIASLSLWNDEEAELFENCFIDSLNRDIFRESWEKIGLAAMGFSRRKPESGGAKLVAAWLEEAGRRAENEDPSASAMLSSLADLYVKAGSVEAWPRNYAVCANIILAAVLKKEGKLEDACELLAISRALLDPAASADDNLALEAKLDINRARCLYEAGRTVEANVAAGRAEITLDRIASGQAPSNLREAADDLRTRIKKESEPQKEQEDKLEASEPSAERDAEPLAGIEDAPVDENSALPENMPEGLPGQEPNAVESPVNEGPFEAAYDFLKQEHLNSLEETGDAAESELGIHEELTADAQSVADSAGTVAYDQPDEEIQPAQMAEIPEEQGGELSIAEPESGSDAIAFIGESEATAEIEDNLASRYVSPDTPGTPPYTEDQKADYDFGSDLSQEEADGSHTDSADAGQGFAEGGIIEPDTNILTAADDAGVAQVYGADIPEMPASDSAEPSEPGEPWSEEAAFELIDTGFQALDENNAALADNIFVQAGNDLSRAGSPPDLVVAAVMEGLVSSSKAMLAEGYPERSVALAEQAVDIGRRYAASAFSGDSWPWWGDAEFLAGRLAHGLGRLEDACEFYSRARDVFLEMADGGNPESRIDAFKIMAARAAALQDLNLLNEAESEYSMAVDHGLQTLVDGLPEDAAVGGVHLARGRLRISLGMLDEAMADYQWALELYGRAMEQGIDCWAEIAAARAGLTEVLILLGRYDEALRMREQTIEAREELNLMGREQEAEAVNALLRNIEDLGRRYVGNTFPQGG